MAVVIFFVAHWQLSVFFQTFFLHRYGAHRMCTMSKGWERFFYVATYVAQGPSFLTPRAYAILHRMHHAFSDTPKDPHSPTNYSGPGALMNMMLATKKKYDDFSYDRVQPEARFDGGLPRWDALDHLGHSWPMRITWCAAYTLFYFKFATAPWMWALLPIQFLMGPVHGAIVNWCGHMYGYKNFDNGDASRNTLIVDFVTLGELFQNNHHKYGMSPNFAARWFELDPTYQVMRLLNLVGIIDMSGAQVMRPPVKEAAAAE